MDDDRAFLSGDWRGSEPVQPAAARPRPAFGKARELHLRARPASHQEERARAIAIIGAGREAMAESFAAVQAGKPLETTELVEIVDAVTASLVRDPLALPSITRLRERHEQTYLHSVAVCGWMIALAQELQLSPELVRDAGLAGLLHDIGKATLPQELLERRGRLSAQDDALLREHPQRGYDILRAMPDMPDIVLDVCHNHHERPDGTGYPLGLIGGSISVYAQMAAVSDFYDKATNPPPGGEKWPSSQAIDYLKAERGAFDERVVRAFVRVVGTFLPGALVRLRSDRLAVVLDETDRDPLHPMVAVFRYIGGAPVPFQRMSTKADPIIGIERPETWGFEDWPELRRKLLALSE
ncbi:HD-GYP domain-containing protein [Sphingomonas panacisoli]|uniref:HD-GYP domain-containing protein n=1 Tax=Sphingomonas panacisoli TaxID=1813879 RepID=A0A5B8LDK3_9SPHN|nr:HD-GYP domain-containing protein [Sphingomonas panacisoli]QDZ06177.1 HD-GYP domain-containing protein [Sphingomonas panacisoli]